GEGCLAGEVSSLRYKSLAKRVLRSLGIRRSSKSKLAIALGSHLGYAKGHEKVEFTMPVVWTLDQLLSVMGIKQPAPPTPISAIVRTHHRHVPGCVWVALRKDHPPEIKKVARRLLKQ